MRYRRLLVFTIMSACGALGSGRPPGGFTCRRAQPLQRFGEEHPRGHSATPIRAAAALRHLVAYQLTVSGSPGVPADAHMRTQQRGERFMPPDVLDFADKMFASA
eukprot:TRINITY_DN8481_c1_g1_i1.p2 TRINITY_DN8481_c1_g1~~TRINITY_DN8481_c1_g1_i1.p2  ORF type:complete len:105 (-),score=10.46 TRINITY_DN8481_c1_g1_i1:93-407(-)